MHGFLVTVFTVLLIVWAFAGLVYHTFITLRPEHQRWYHVVAFGPLYWVIRGIEVIERLFRI